MIYNSLSCLILSLQIANRKYVLVINRSEEACLKRLGVYSQSHPSPKPSSHFSPGPGDAWAPTAMSWSWKHLQAPQSAASLLFPFSLNVVYHYSGVPQWIDENGILTSIRLLTNDLFMIEWILSLTETFRNTADRLRDLLHASSQLPQHLYLRMCL